VVTSQMSQETLAEIVGTTRQRVNFFMNRFRKLGFVDYNGGLEVHSSPLNIVLCDSRPRSTLFGAGTVRMAHLSSSQ